MTDAAPLVLDPADDLHARALARLDGRALQHPAPRHPGQAHRLVSPPGYAM
ncbi:MAG: hypothetical protein ACRDT9_04230 [Agromyces sp.]